MQAGTVPKPRVLTGVLHVNEHESAGRADPCVLRHLDDVAPADVTVYEACTIHKRTAAAPIRNQGFHYIACRDLTAYSS